MKSVYYIRKWVAQSTYMFTFTTAAIAIPEFNDFVLLRLLRGFPSYHIRELPPPIGIKCPLNLGRFTPF